MTAPGSKADRDRCSRCLRPIPARHLISTRRGAMCGKCADRLPPGWRHPPPHRATDHAQHARGPQEGLWAAPTTSERVVR
jgi:recombinational DNA repair protein (RecF pathway)